MRTQFDKIFANEMKWASDRAGNLSQLLSFDKDELLEFVGLLLRNSDLVQR